MSVSTSTTCLVISCTDVAKRFKNPRQPSSLGNYSLGAHAVYFRYSQIIKRSSLFNKAVENCEEICLELANKDFSKGCQGKKLAYVSISR